MPREKVRCFYCGRSENDCDGLKRLKIIGWVCDSCAATQEEDDPNVDVDGYEERRRQRILEREEKL